MIRRPPRSTHCISSAASDVYKRQAGSIVRNFPVTERGDFANEGRHVDFSISKPQVVSYWNDMEELEEAKEKYETLQLAIEKSKAYKRLPFEKFEAVVEKTYGKIGEPKAVLTKGILKNFRNVDSEAVVMDMANENLINDRETKEEFKRSKAYSTTVDEAECKYDVKGNNLEDQFENDSRRGNKIQAAASEKQKFSFDFMNEFEEPQIKANKEIEQHDSSKEMHCEGKIVKNIIIPEDAKPQESVEEPHEKSIETCRYANTIFENPTSSKQDQKKETERRIIEPVSYTHLTLPTICSV
eukprot:TRINITY_DN4618_c0_g1_i1.p1 TRINITY_DN4618_c0_g1~~TRINITY_DN4618_c0_g1_i1.p1  ORF type:complete len:306 (-),score=67.52 TRINITY_DN4618_c0_g1_i1:47-940(-)